MSQTIENVPHHLCTGCGACYNCCPKDAIIMEYDSEGFLMPRVTDQCINCGLCLKICPVISPLKLNDTPKSFAVWAQDEIRQASSSGGMFSLLAESIFKQAGMVCGAAYTGDYRKVQHIWADKLTSLAPLRGSKYVQSDTKLTFRKAKAYLEQGRPVLYTGCPCQIAGLYNYLGKPYENLYTADLICHGATSLTAYQSFLDEFCEGKELEKFDFRDKTYYSWSSSTVAFFKDGTVKKRGFNEETWYTGLPARR